MLELTLSGYNKTMIDPSRIMYIRAKNNLIKFYLNDGSERHQWTRLKYIAKYLSDKPSFMLVHRSYIVNRSFIKSFRANEIYLQNDIIIPIGITMKNKVHLWIREAS